MSEELEEKCWILVKNMTFSRILMMLWCHSERWRIFRTIMEMMEVSVPCPGSSQCLLYSFVLTLGLLAPNKCSSTDGRLPDERQWFYFVYASLGTYFSALFFAVLNYAIKSECQPHQRQQSQELVSLLYAPQKLIFQLRSWVLLTFQLLLFNGGLLLCKIIFEIKLLKQD